MKIKLASVLFVLVLLVALSSLTGCILPHILRGAEDLGGKQVVNNLKHTAIVSDGHGLQYTLAPGASAIVRYHVGYTTGYHGAYGNGYYSGWASSGRRACLLATVWDAAGNYLGATTHDIYPGDCTPWVITWFTPQAQ